MIAEKAKESINKAVAYELQNIVNKYGAVYASEHEAYAILKEEAEEVSEALTGLTTMLDTIWRRIRENTLSADIVKACADCAIDVAEEAVQCAAVCERFLCTLNSK